MAEASSSQTTLRSSAARPTSSSPQKPASSSSSISRPALSAHTSATISELASFQGTHPISIGAGTVIHPRAKLLTFEGPISIGEGCILGEKSVIGGGKSGNSSARQVSAEADAEEPSESARSTPTILESSIQVGPLATISEGSHVRSAATIDTSASLGKCVRIGEHAKVCASCCIPDNVVVDDWIVIWGNGTGNNYGSGLQRRRKPHDRGRETTEGLGVRDVETARLTVLNRERESLTKLLDTGTGARRK